MNVCPFLGRRPPRGDRNYTGAYRRKGSSALIIIRILRERAVVVSRPTAPIGLRGRRVFKRPERFVARRKNGEGLGSKKSDDAWVRADRAEPNGSRPFRFGEHLSLNHLSWSRDVRSSVERMLPSPKLRISRNNAGAL